MVYYSYDNGFEFGTYFEADSYESGIYPGVDSGGTSGTYSEADSGEYGL